MVEKLWLLTQTHLGVSRKEQQVLLSKDVTSTLSISLKHMPDSMRHLLVFPYSQPTVSLSLAIWKYSEGMTMKTFPFLHLLHIQVDWRVSSQSVPSLTCSCADSPGVYIPMTPRWHFMHQHSYRNILYLLPRQVKECLKPWHKSTHV